MRTIALLLHSRPPLLEGSLTALLNCQDLDKFDNLLLSVDGGHDQFDCLKKMAGASAEAMCRVVPNCRAMCFHENQGIVEHPRNLLKLAFEDLNSDLMVMLEDDALLKPDALRFALWFEEYSKVHPDVALASMCNHRAFGRGQTGGNIPEDDPSIVCETPYVTSPFAWTTTSGNWGFLRKWWGFKKVAPTAWSFSASMAMRMTGKIGLHPVLSRCQNVGREGGVFETPESFDRSQRGLVYRDDPYYGEYAVRAKLDRSCLGKLDDWMVPEYEVRVEREPSKGASK